MKAIIIGNGFLAKSFSKIKLNNVIIFASGVSDSSCRNKKYFLRELNKIKKTKRDYPNIKIIYFSSCSVEDPSRKNKDYQKHKINIEKYIQAKYKDYLILRLPEVMGRSSNKKTLINNFIDKIRNNKTINTSKLTYRNLINIDDVIKVVSYLNKKNYNKKIINIVNQEMYSSIYIINSIENILKFKSNIKFDNRFKNDDFSISLKAINKIYKILNIRFNKNYLHRALKKYYL